jgi:arabinofuranan 3-O-arabinosyltransferase
VTRLSRPVELTCFALCVAQLAYLAASFVQGTWIVDTNGRLIATDFVNIWASGRQALDGAAAAVYDALPHKQAQAMAVGHSFEGEYPWIYPPTFLFVATVLACLPFLWAYLSWVALTFAAYVVAIRAIIGERAGFLLACAYPGILSNLLVGQNGFASSALIAGALLFLQTRPVLAGCLIGLVSFKPHLGILFPLVLVAGGHWRVIAAAAAVLGLMFVASWAVFGIESWQAFLQSIPAASQAALVEGRADWAKLQSIFAVTRTLGGSAALAWTLQLLLAGAVAAVLLAMWRSKISFPIKAAAFATASLLVTPYLFLYDLVVLAVAMAFLLRAGQSEGPLRGEMAGLGAASLLILVFPLVKAPVGFAATLLVGFLVLRRAWRELSAPARPPVFVPVPQAPPAPL